MSENNVIADKDGIPWNIEEDFEHYMSTVSGHSLVVGRKTYESMGKNPGEKVVVLSRRDSLDLGDDEHHARSVSEAKSILEDILDDDEEVYVIGGENVYREFLDTAEKMVISHIDGEYTGIVHFPEFDHENWDVTDVEEYEDFTVKWYSRDK